MANAITKREILEARAADLAGAAWVPVPNQTPKEFEAEMLVLEINDLASYLKGEVENLKNYLPRYAEFSKHDLKMLIQRMERATKHYKD